MKICHTCQQTYSNDVEFCPRDGARLAAQATETEAQLAAGLSRRFRIVRRLGAGGMGTVFLAEQIGVGNRPVALKVLNRKLLDDPDFLLRFQNEAGSTGRIRHTNVVTIYEAAQADDGTPYIAMEYLEGESLRDALKRRGALPVTEVADILQQAARGLNAAHKLGIIHRDLKPDNIFLTYPDDDVGAGLVPALPVGMADPGRAQGPPPRPVVVKVVDFGIAKMRESDTPTQSGMMLGTPAYMSCEQAFGMRSDELDGRSDVYSLGVMVYEMLTGRLPFHSDTPAGFLRKHLMEEPPPFGSVAQGLGVPPAVETAVMKALVKDRNHRYASALDFARELNRAAQPLTRAEGPATLTPARIGSMPAAQINQLLRSKGIDGSLELPTPSGNHRAKVNPQDGLNYVWIPPGSLQMGCSPGDDGCFDPEKPPHQVSITKGFWLGETEVTVSAYKRFAVGTGKQMPPAPDFNPDWSNQQMPMVNVTWDDAQAYCAWARGRLPSEAEWEYAARAGNTSARYGGLDEIAWYADNSGRQRLDSATIWKEDKAGFRKCLHENGNGTHEVGQKFVNRFGLYDTLGNVWEWVQDWYGETYYQRSPSQDPTGPTSQRLRVLRGGSWLDFPSLLRVSVRNMYAPDSMYVNVGFRCVLVAPAPDSYSFSLET